MIKELGEEYEYKTDWTKKINLSVSLRDLQIIYDCIGAVPSKYLELKHKNTRFPITEFSELINHMYDEIDCILDRHNAITDYDSNINNNVELEVINNE